MLAVSKLLDLTVAIQTIKKINMSSLHYVVLCLALVASIHAVPEDVKSTIKEALKPVVESCSKETSISLDDLKAAKANGKLSEVDPCFHACMFKKTGLMNEKGLYNVEVAIEKNKKYLTDANDLKIAGDVANNCAKVNQESVSDGEKGCDRAKLLFTCLVSQKSLFTV